MSYYDVDRRVAGLIPGRNLNVTGSAPAGPGEKTASEYIVSGVPFISGSESSGTGAFEIPFPMITQWIVVSNDSDTDMEIHSVSPRSSHDYFSGAKPTQMK